MAKITWYVLDHLATFKERLLAHAARRDRPTYLIHLITTYAPNVQKYGTEYFNDLDGILAYFNLDYLQSGLTSVPRSDDPLSRGTYFIGESTHRDPSTCLMATEPPRYRSVPMSDADASLDGVFCKSYVEHLREPSGLAEDCYRALKPRGKVLFLTPDWESNHRIFFNDVTHVSPFSTVIMQQLLELSGFENVISYRFRQLPVTWRYPAVNAVSAAIVLFVHSRTTRKFLRWSRELMVCGVGIK